MSKENIKILGHCDLCGCDSGGFLVLARETPNKGSILSELGITYPYETVMCRSCGWIFKPGVFSDDQLDKLYSKLGGEATFNEGCEGVSQIRSEQLYLWLTKHIPRLKKKCAVLDVGGGVGQATSVFANKGYNVTVLDMAGKELIHKNMKLEKLSIYVYRPSQKFDLAILNHVSEHVWDPTKLFSFVRKMLLPNGYLYIEVPFELVTPLLKRKLGDPCHVGYFSIHTLEAFLKKCNYEVLRTDRALGWYNDRRVMVLRALARRKDSDVRSIDRNFSYRMSANAMRIKNHVEIFNVSQLCILFLYICKRVISKFFQKLR